MSDQLSSSEIGVVFDLDGVLIDSHDQHERSWFQLAHELGKPLTKEQFKESFGMRNVMCIPHVFHWADADDHETIHALGERKEELYRELLAADGIEPLPGVVALLESLAAAGGMGLAVPVPGTPENGRCGVDTVQFQNEPFGIVENLIRCRRIVLLHLLQRMKTDTLTSKCPQLPLQRRQPFPKGLLRLGGLRPFHRLFRPCDLGIDRRFGCLHCRGSGRVLHGEDFPRR
jgi:hypothetical protein